VSVAQRAPKQHNIPSRNVEVSIVMPCLNDLDPQLTMREVIPSVVLLALGTQTVFASFFISIFSIDLS
jgi:hypothetical protein